MSDYVGHLWAVRHKSGYLFHDTVRARRADAISAFIGDGAKSWRWWRKKYGVSAVRVVLHEEATDE